MANFVEKTKISMFLDSKENLLVFVIPTIIFILYVLQH